MKEIFSVQLENNHKVIKIFGIKFKFKKDTPCRQNRSLNPRYYRSYLQLLADTNNLTTEKKIWYLSQIFYNIAGYFPNFKNPKSFNEKLNWLRLNYFNPTEMLCDDKYEFKEYITKQLGGGYTIPTYGIYEDVNDIDFEKLPKQFVIKTTTNSTGRGITIVKDKSKLDIERIKYDYNEFLQDWHIANKQFLFPTNPKAKPRIIIEEYKQELETKACDYKFFCFHGEPKLFYIANNFATNNTQETQIITVYDLEGNRLPIVYSDHPRSKIEKLKKSQNFDKMVEIARKLSAPFPFARVDFYDLEKQLYIGEMTFKSGGGFSKFTPREWDYKLGELLDLKKIPNQYLHVLPGFEKPLEY